MWSNGRGRALIETILILAAFLALLAFFRSYADDAAGGADSYGYVSETLRLNQGHFSRPEHVLGPFGLPENSAITAPLGWVSKGPTQTVPTYPFGYPFLMLIALRIAGFPAIFWVTPVLGSATVVLTFLLGRTYLGYAGGALAAAFALLLPNFLMFAAQPMSDVPAAFCATLALYCLLRPVPSTLSDATVAIAEGIGIWIRPNLSILVIPIIAWLLWRGERARLIRFALCLVPFVCVEALINTHLYGKPWTTGYGSLPLTRDLPNALARGARYLRRLNDQQAGIGLVLVTVGFALGKLSWRTRALLLGFAGVLLLFFAFYPIDDAWWYGRFLLPGLPAVAILEASGIVRLYTLVSRRWMLAVAALAGCIAFASFASSSLAFARSHFVFDLGPGDLQYQHVAKLVASSIGPRSLVLAMQHSGSLRLYGGINTMRYDLAPTPELVSVLRKVVSAGGSIYLLGEGWEIQRIRGSDRKVLLVDAQELGHVGASQTTLFRVNALSILKPANAAVPHRLDTLFGNQLALRGFALTPNEPRSGEELTVTLYWQALQRPDHNYTVFVHLENHDGKVIAQSDSYPVQGRYPTTSWSLGYVVKDVHQFTIPTNVASRHLHLVVGLYRLRTMQRLQPLGSGVPPHANFVEIGTLSLGQP